jgi:hypothetical protein
MWKTGEIRTMEPSMNFDLIPSAHRPTDHPTENPREPQKSPGPKPGDETHIPKPG